MPEVLNADLISGNMLSIIHKFMIFDRLDLAALKSVLSMADSKDGHRLAQVSKFDKGEKIISEGDFGSVSFWVIKGIFDVVQEGVHIATLNTPGEVFGEMSMFEKIPRTATVTAVTEGICLSLDMSMIENFEDSRIKAIIRQEFRDIMLSRLQATQDWLEAEKARLEQQYDNLMASKRKLAERLRLEG